MSGHAYRPSGNPLKKKQAPSQVVMVQQHFHEESTGGKQVVEVPTYLDLPIVGIPEVIYITLDDNHTYRYSPTEGYIGMTTGADIVWGDLQGDIADQGDLQIALDAKQDDLVSGTSIKTVNGTSLLGSGDLFVGGAVDSVNSQTGVVVLDTDDIGETAARVFVTPAEKSAITHSNRAVLDATTASFTTADETKLDNITVTQAVDLDQMEVDIAALANGMVYKGNWDASAGTFPGAGSAKIGRFYTVSVAGTVGGQAFNIGDRLIAIVNNASTTVFTANWSILDATDAVTSVFSRTGNVVATNGDYTASQITNVPAGSIAAVTVQAAIAELDAEKQPLDADLTTIAGLTATTDNFMQAKAGAWASRTIAQVKTDLSLTGTNSGDQTITLTGDVTGSGTGSFATTIANNAVTFAKMQAITDGRLLGASGGTAVEEITVGTGLILSGNTLSSTASSGVAGTLDVNTTSVGNVGAGEDDLITYSVTGGTLSTNGDYLSFDTSGTVANSINGKRIRVKFGSTTIFDTGASGIPISTAFDRTCRGEIIRTSSTTFKANVYFNSAVASLSAYADYSTGTETLANTLVLKMTGEATSTNDVVQETMITRVNSTTTDALLAYATKTGTETLTNKTIALGSNTVSGNASQFNTACTDDNFAFLGQSNVYTANQSIPLNSPQGFLINGKIATSVTSNNLTVAIKTLSGTDPTSTDPVYCRIGDTVRTLTGALSVTTNAGTNWCNSGSTELAAREVDYFVYLSWRTASSNIQLGFSRISYGRLYSDFSGTSTNEKYAAFSAAPASTDQVENIGRFNATLSAGAGFTWSIPATIVIINRPIYETRWLTWSPSYTPTGSMTFTSVGGTHRYMLSSTELSLNCMFTGTTGGSASYGISQSIPFASVRVIADGIAIKNGGGYDTGTVNKEGSGLEYRIVGSVANWGLGANRGGMLTKSIEII